MTNKFEINGTKPFPSYDYKPILESCPNNNWYTYEKLQRDSKPKFMSKSSPLRDINNFNNCAECNYHQNMNGSYKKLIENSTPTLSNSQNIMGSNSYLQISDSQAPMFNNYHHGFECNTPGRLKNNLNGQIYNNNTIYAGAYSNVPHEYPYNQNNFNRRNNLHNISAINRYQQVNFQNDFKIIEDNSPLSPGLPSEFNPRAAKDMSVRDKVKKWIDDIPLYEAPNDVWKNNCFQSDYSLNWEEIEFDNKDSLNDGKEQHISLVSSDELLYLQSKKIDSLVRLVYTLEEEVNSKDGETNSRSYYNNINNNELEFENDFEVDFS